MDPRLRHWARAFAVASLVHLALPDFEQPGWWAPRLLNVAGAVWLLWRPARGAFLLCAAATAWPLLFLRDVLTQSMYLTWCALAAALLRSPESILQSIRWLTAGTYLLAALHKLNAAFFDPAQSCAHHAWAQVAERWQLPTPEPLTAALPAMVVALEVALGAAVLLRSPLLWPLGLAFHLPLTVTLAPAFGAVMLSGYVAATPARAAVRWRRVRRHGGLVLLAGVLAGVLDAALGALDPWLLSKVVATGALLAASLLALGPPWWRPVEVRRGAAVVAVAWFLHGLTPYFGVQYQHAAAMLSNLRIDAGCHNSWIFPEALRGADPYVRIDVASIGDGLRPERVALLRETLWNVPALHAMRRNWCLPEQRPIRLAGTWRGRTFAIEDLCAESWLAALPGAGWDPPGFQRFQKNLQRSCAAACIH